MKDRDFDHGLDVYQARLQVEALEAEERSWAIAARPYAERQEIPFADLCVGDYITGDGIRWAVVCELRGPHAYVRSRQAGCRDGNVAVLFEIPEPVTVSGETRFWLERPADELVFVDRGTR